MKIKKKNKVFLIIYLIVFLALSLMAGLKYYNLNSNIADLGIFLNKIYNIAILQNYSSAFQGHFNPIIFLLAPIFILENDIPVYLILFIQTIIITSPSIYIYFKFGLFFSLIYLLLPSIWFIGVFDFHLDIFIISLTLLFFHYFEKKNFYKCLVITGLFCIIKEIYILTSIACCILIIYETISNSSQKNYKLVFITFIILILYFFLFIFINEFFLQGIGNKSFFSGRHSSEGFNYLGNNFFIMPIQIIKNLPEIFFDIFTSSKKIKYLVAIFLPVMFICFVYPKYLILAAPPLLILMLSKNNIYINHTNHYSSGFILPIFFSFIHGYLLIEKKLKLKIRGLFFLIFFLVHVYMSPSPISRLFYSNKISEYNYETYLFSDRKKKIKNFLKNYNFEKEMISIQNNINFYKILKIPNYFLFPDGIIDASEYIIYKKGFKKFNYQTSKAKYVIIDAKKKKFIKDEGCEYIYDKCQNIKILEEYERNKIFLKKYYKIIFSYDGFYVFKKE